MSHPTLTIAQDEKRPELFTTFAFVRGFDGQGDWITQTSNGRMPANCMVHLTLQSELTQLAKARKISEPHNFARTIPKPVKEKAVRGPRKPKAPKSGLIGGFNPFAMG